MIAFDFDDVIFNLSSLLLEELQKRTGTKITERPSYYIDIPGYTNEELDKLIGDIIRDKTTFGEPVQYAIDSLEKIYQIIDRPILIITARRPDTRKNTEIWLDMNIKKRFPYEIRFTSSQTKSKFFDDDIRFFVDDLPHFANEAAKNLERVFLVNKEWNQNIHLNTNVSRIDDLRCVVKFLTTLNKQEKLL